MVTAKAGATALVIRPVLVVVVALGAVLLVLALAEMDVQDAKILVKTPVFLDVQPHV